MDCFSCYVETCHEYDAQDAAEEYEEQLRVETVRSLLFWLEREPGHPGAILRWLEYEYWEVRSAAMKKLAKLTPSALSGHEDAIVSMQTSKHMDVREWAIGLTAALYAPGSANARAAEVRFERASAGL